MPTLDYSAEFETELEALYAEDEDSAALIDALLFELEEWPELLDELCIAQRHWAHKPTFEIKRFKEVWQSAIPSTS